MRPSASASKTKAVRLRLRARWVRSARISRLRNSAPNASEAAGLCSNSMGAPASNSAPISRSPLMPAKHSRYPIRISLFCKAGQHLDGQNLVHRPGAVSFAIERDVTESGSAHHGGHGLQFPHLQGGGHL